MRTDEEIEKRINEILSNAVESIWYIKPDILRLIKEEIGKEKK